MTSALIPLAASSLLALSNGNPGGQGNAPAAQPAPHAAQAARNNGPAARGQGPARPADARPAGARAAARSGSHGRTPPDRSGSSGHSSASGSGSPPPSSSGGGSPPPSSRGHAAPARGASSHAVPAHPAHAGRPGPAPGHRPPAHRYGPWNPAPHRAYVVRHHHVAPYHPRYWTAGVFVYEAPPPRTVVVAGQPPRAARSAAPAREVDRSNSLALGVRSGSYMSGYYNEASYGDLGFGLSARYRGDEALGVEVSYGYFSDNFGDDTERVTKPLSASVELFAFPWTTVSPYLAGGVTWTSREYTDTYVHGDVTETFEVNDVQFGPHLGLGVEMALGKKSSINLEGRYTHFVSHVQGDPSTPDNLQGIVGLNMYF